MCRILPHAQACAEWVLVGETWQRARAQDTDDVNFDEREGKEAC